MHSLRTAASRMAFPALVAGGLIVSAIGSEARATVLLDETFSGTVIADGLTLTTTQNLNTWIDFPNSNRWGISSGGICTGPLCSGDFAQHLPQTSDNTNLLYYGLSAAGVAPGSTLTLSFSYIASERDGRAYIGGLTGSQQVDPFAPWFQPGDANDGVVLQSASMTQTRTWATGSVSVVLGAAQEVLVVAFEMGGTGGARGVDNVRLEVTPVPEPATLGLLGAGLLGLAAASRRRREG